MYRLLILVTFAACLFSLGQAPSALAADKVCAAGATSCVRDRIREGCVQTNPPYQQNKISRWRCPDPPKASYSVNTAAGPPPVYQNHFWLAAFNETGGWCGVNCEVIAISYYCTPDCVVTDFVPGTALPQPCSGFAWNYGWSWCGLQRFKDRITYGVGTLGSTTEVYLRKKCPISGYHFSNHNYFQIRSYDWFVYLGRFQITDPGGCFQTLADSELAKTAGLVTP